MSVSYSSGVRAEAERQLQQEKFKAAVELEKHRLRSKRPIIDRLLDLLPFTVTIRRKK